MTPKGKDILIKVNDIEICYDDLGTGNIPIIFIHGFPFDKSSWQPQLDELQKSFRVIAFDNRGYGKSTTDGSDFSMDLFADDLIKFMDGLQLKKAIACGLSMGGYILLNAIDRHPDRFQKLILADTQCTNDNAEAKEKRYKTIKQVEDGGLEEFTEGFLKNAFIKNSIEYVSPLVDDIRKVIMSTPVQTITSTLKALANREDTCRVLDNINIPTLILCGKEDMITPPAKSEFLHQGIKLSILQIIDNAGHLSNLEQPSTFNGNLKAFLENFH